MKMLVMTASAVLVGAFAAAQEGPLFTNSVELRHAYAIEATKIELETLTLEEARGADELEVGTVTNLFYGSLEAQNPDLYGELSELIETAEEQWEEGSPELEGTVARANELLDEAYTTLVGDTANDPLFQSGVMTFLSLLYPSVGENYEDAAEDEPDAYYFSYVGFQRLKEMWNDISAQLDVPEQEEEINRIFTFVDTLLPSASIPERFSDPEDVEVAAADIAFALEAATGTPILPRRLGDVGVLAKTHAEAACAADTPLLTAEEAAWAYIIHRKYTRRAVQFIAADAGEAITEGLQGLYDDPESDSALSACGDLSAHFDEAIAAIGDQ